MIKLILILVALASATTIVATTQAQTNNSPSYYLVPWEWHTETSPTGTEHSYWKAKYFVEGAVFDLRSTTQKSVPGGPEQCCAIIVSNIDAPDAIQLSNGLAGQALNVDRVEELLKLPDLDSKTFPELAYKIIVENSDPTGIERWKPVKFNEKGLLTANIGKYRMFTVRAKRGTVGYDKVIEVYQRDYDRIEDVQLRRKVAGYWEIEFGYDIRRENQKSDGIEKPSTTITDDFNCANSDNPDCDLDWTEVTSDWDIASNQLTIGINGTATVRAESDLSSDDQRAEIDCSNLGNFQWCGIAIRFDSSADTMYYYAFKNQNSSNQLYERVAGTDTNLTADLDEYCSTSCADRRLFIEMEGSDIIAGYDNITKTSVSDGTITGNTRCGVFGLHSAPNYDNFMCEDLGAEPPADRRIFVVE